MTDPNVTIDDELAAIKAARAALQAQEDTLLKRQQLVDYKAVLALEEEHGVNRIVRFDLDGWKSGEDAATMIAVRIPRAKEQVVKRYEQTVAKTKEGDGKYLDAHHLLARACVVYPSEKDAKQLLEATMDLAAGALSNIGLAVMKIVQGKVDDEKKG